MNPQSRPATLSAAFARTVNQPGRYGDGRGSHGLSLLVTRRKNGRLSKRWSQRVRINGRETNLGLGVFPIVTLAEARQKALKNRRAIEQGRSLRARKAPTFHQAMEQVIELQSAQWRPGSRTPQIWRSSLERFAGSLADVPVDKITTGQVLAVLAPIWHTKPETASKVRRRISGVLKWCVAAEYRVDNPADERVLAALGKNARPPTHQRALPHSEVGTAIRNLEASRRAHWATVAALKLLILTATRSGEVRNATWDEIDLPEAIWTIPKDRTKTGREHRVPLSAGAIAVLDEARQHTGGVGLVFPSKTGKVLSSEGLSKICKERDVGCVPHGFRSSFRDWCGETGVAREVAERALGHAIKNPVEKAYSRTGLLGLRTELMQAWAEYLGGS